MNRRVFLTAPVAASLCAVVLLGAQCRGSEPQGPLGTSPAATPTAAAPSADQRPPDDGLTESEFAERLPGIDPTGLSPKQRAELTDLANDTFCPCAAKTVAGCLRTEPQCKPAARLVELAKKFIVGGRPASTTLVYVETYYGSFAEDRRRPVGTEGPRKGAANAKVTLVEFSDFECPACGAAHPALGEIAKKYPNDVAVVFRNYPLPMHPNAAAAAAMGEYAFATGGNEKFWSLADLFFANQRNLAEAGLKQYAKQAGLDPAAAFAATTDAKWTGLVNEDVAEGQKLQVASTPTIYVNGRQNVLPATPEFLAWTIEDELEWIARGKRWSSK